MNAERKEAKRERILDAAVVEIAGRGYYRATVSDIAGRAGVADGTIYLYFKGKEDILVSIFERAMERFNEEARRIVDEGAGDPSRIRDYLALIAQVVEDGKADGVFRPDVDALFVAKVVFGILDEMATDWVLSRKNVRLASRSDSVNDLLLGGLRAS